MSISANHLATVAPSTQFNSVQSNFKLTHITSLDYWSLGHFQRVPFIFFWSLKWPFWQEIFVDLIENRSTSITSDQACQSILSLRQNNYIITDWRPQIYLKGLPQSVWSVNALIYNFDFLTLFFSSSFMDFTSVYLPAHQNLRVPSLLHIFFMFSVEQMNRLSLVPVLYFEDQDQRPFIKIAPYSKVIQIFCGCLQSVVPRWEVYLSGLKDFMWSDDDLPSLLSILLKPLDTLA